MSSFDISISAPIKLLSNPLSKSISKEAQKVSADTGLTYTQSKLLVKEANKQVAAFGNQLSTQSDIIAVQKEQIAQLGVIGKLSGEQAGAVSDIGKAFGYGAAQAVKVNAAFMAMGVSADNAANAQRDLAAEALKSGVNVATVTKDIADNAGATAKFFGGNVKALKAGIYFYTVTQNNQSVKTDKLVVE